MPDRLTADVIRDGIANRLFAGSLQMPLPVVADSGIFLLGNSAPIGVMPGRPAADGAFKMSMAARMLADCPRLREQEESKISIITTGFRAYVCTR